MSVLYSLGFAEFVAGLITDQVGYELSERVLVDQDNEVARFIVQNAIGEKFVVGLQHIRERPK